MLVIRKSYQFVHFLLLLLLVALLIIACQNLPIEAPTSIELRDSTSDCRLVKHEMGETKVCGQPQRVAVLSPHILDSILSLGVQPFAYATDGLLNLKKFDQPKKQIPYLGNYVTSQPINVGDRKNPSLELLAKIKPDLILSEAWLAKEKYDLLSQISPTLLFSYFGPDDQKDWRYDIEGIAKALGREDKAKELLTRYPDQISTVRDQLASVVAAHPRVLCISTDNLASTIYLEEDYTVTRLLQEVGFKIVSPQNSSLVPGNNMQISIEVLPQVETDLIFVMAWSNNNLKNPQEKVKQQWVKNPLLKQLPAFKNGHMFFVDYFIWGGVTRGPIADGLILEQLPQLLNPLNEESG
ncbi:ABC transporter substrate-binding protein [Myxacorys almedinensis A]|uniref:ABC transporter substrate-binding protein n=2 Tax=Myxacorys TaxID=2056239 RepID=A0A8J7Z9E0_9CYAN|nr:ABC transporter substrate-binding protein [Myxacorys almedinensis A]